ncbi:hypothetical protein BDZ97DRAFT_1809792, partial [Flammula alnicola]
NLHRHPPRNFCLLLSHCLLAATRTIGTPLEYTLFILSTGRTSLSTCCQPALELAQLNGIGGHSVIICQRLERIEAGVGNNAPTML